MARTGRTRAGRPGCPEPRAGSSRPVRSCRAGLLAGVADGGSVRPCPWLSRSAISKSVSKISSLVAPRPVSWDLEDRSQARTTRHRGWCRPAASGAGDNSCSGCPARGAPGTGPVPRTYGSAGGPRCLVAGPRYKRLPLVRVSGPGQNPGWRTSSARVWQLSDGLSFGRAVTLTLTQSSRSVMRGYPCPLSSIMPRHGLVC